MIMLMLATACQLNDESSWHLVPEQTALMNSPTEGKKACEGGHSS